MLGIDPERQREMMDESLGVIIRLLEDTEPVTCKHDWFELRDAVLQLRPYQQPFPIAVASVQSPAGVRLAGKHGTAVLSMSVPRGIIRETSLKELWDIAEEAAAENGQTVRREDWGIVSGVHLAESRKEAFEDIRVGGARVVTEYFDQTLGHGVPDVPFDQIVDFMVEHNQWIVGTPDDCIAGIERLQEMSGGFGKFMVRVEDWALREKILHSYELPARYVMPHVHGTLAGIVASNRWASEQNEQLQVNRRAGLQRATDAYFAHRR
jgi:limonene 1,2-monooxygenase